MLEDYRDALLELKKQEGHWDTVMLSHGPATIDKGILDGVIAVCEEILADTNDWQPFDFMGNTPRIAKKEENHVRLDGGLGNIVYDPTKVFAAK